MSTLQVHITAGPQAGARLQLNQSPVSFGRSQENALVLDLPVVSRQHGELLIDEDTGQWLLVNHSANGTRVGRKKITKKPITLTDGAVVTIGETEVFRVHLAGGAPEADAPYAAAAPAGTAASADDEDFVDIAPGTGAKGRSKLWIGLGIWFGLCILAMIFFATLGGSGDENTAAWKPWVPGQNITDMTPGQDRGITEIRRMLAEEPDFEDPNPSRFTQAINKATEAADENPRGLFDSYRYFQLAISYTDNQQSPLATEQDQLYQYVLQELAEAIYKKYIYAYRLYNTGDYKGALDELTNLRRAYYRTSDAGDKLAGHIEDLRNAARKKAGRP